MHLTTRFTSFAGCQTKGQLDSAARLTIYAPPHVVARGNLAMLRFHEDETLPTISVPVLVVAGENDRLTLKSAMEHIRQRIPNASLASLGQAGHLGIWEQHQRLSQLLIEFCEQKMKA